MKFLAGLVAFFILFGLVAISYAQFAVAQNERLPEIFIQIQVHDSNGYLVGYTEGQPQIFYLENIIEWLEPKANKTIIKQGEKNFVLMRYEYKIFSDTTQASGAYFLKLPIDGNMKTALYFHHDSFHLSPGDTITILWTLISPVN